MSRHRKLHHVKTGELAARFGVFHLYNITTQDEPERTTKPTTKPAQPATAGHATTTQSELIP